MASKDLPKRDASQADARVQARRERDEREAKERREAREAKQRREEQGGFEVGDWRKRPHHPDGWQSGGR